MNDSGAVRSSASARAVRLWELQRAAYAVEADIIGDDRIPPLHESLTDLLRTRLRWLFEHDTNGSLVGAVGFHVQRGVIDIDRLVVDPARHREGIGRRLVTRVLELGDSAVVSTGRSNAPARLLYEREGFVHRQDREVVPGLWVSDYGWCRHEGAG